MNKNTYKIEIELYGVQTTEIFNSYHSLDSDELLEEVNTHYDIGNQTILLDIIQVN